MTVVASSVVVVEPERFDVILHVPGEIGRHWSSGVGMGVPICARELETEKASSSTSAKRPCFTGSTCSRMLHRHLLVAFAGKQVAHRVAVFMGTSRY